MSQWCFLLARTAAGVRRTVPFTVADDAAKGGLVRWPARRRARGAGTAWRWTRWRRRCLGLSPERVLAPRPAQFFDVNTW